MSRRSGTMGGRGRPSGGPAPLPPGLGDNLLRLFVSEGRGRLSWSLIRRQYEALFKVRITMGMLKELAFVRFTKIDPSDPKSDSWVTLSVEHDDWEAGKARSPSRLHLNKDANICPDFERGSMDIRSLGGLSSGSGDRVTGCNRGWNCGKIRRPSMSLAERLKKVMGGKNSMNFGDVIALHNQMFPQLALTHAPTVYGVRKRLDDVYEVKRNVAGSTRPSDMTIVLLSRAKRKRNDRRAAAAAMTVRPTTVAMRSSAKSSSGFSWGALKAQRKKIIEAKASPPPPPAVAGAGVSDGKIMDANESRVDQTGTEVISTDDAGLIGSVMHDYLKPEPLKAPSVSTESGATAPVASETGASAVGDAYSPPIRGRQRIGKARVGTGAGSKPYALQLLQPVPCSLEDIRQLAGTIESQTGVSIVDVVSDCILRTAIVDCSDCSKSVIQDMLHKSENGWIEGGNRTLRVFDASDSIGGPTLRITNINCVISDKEFAEFLSTLIQNSKVLRIWYDFEPDNFHSEQCSLVFQSFDDASRVLSACQSSHIIFPSSNGTPISIMLSQPERSDVPDEDDDGVTQQQPLTEPSFVEDITTDPSWGATTAGSSADREQGGPPPPSIEDEKSESPAVTASPSAMMRPPLAANGTPKQRTMPPLVSSTPGLMRDGVIPASEVDQSGPSPPAVEEEMVKRRMRPPIVSKSDEEKFAESLEKWRSESISKYVSMFEDLCELGAKVIAESQGLTQSLPSAPELNASTPQSARMMIEKQQRLTAPLFHAEKIVKENLVTTQNHLFVLKKIQSAVSGVSGPSSSSSSSSSSSVPRSGPPIGGAVPPVGGGMRPPMAPSTGAPVSSSSSLSSSNGNKNGRIPVRPLEKQVDATLVQTDGMVKLYLTDPTLKWSQQHMESLYNELCKTLGVSTAEIKQEACPEMYHSCSRVVTITMPYT